MKTKLLFTLVFLTLLVEKSSSQTYIPMLNNSTWNIVVAGQLGAQNYPTSQGIDVIIGTFTYKKFLDPTTNTDVYLREDAANRRVYTRVNGSDNLLYDFSLQSSNSITLVNGITYVATVSTVNVVGGTRKMISLYNAGAPTETWIEGVGSDRNPFRPTYELFSDPYIYLTCSAQNGINIYNYGITNGQTTPTDCSMLLSVEEMNYLKQDVNLSPNPFQTQLSISKKSIFENSKLKIFNSIGQVVKTMENITGQNIIIDRDDLKSGIYYIQITENGKIISTNKIIISD